VKTNFNKEIEFVVDDREVRSGVLELLKSYEDVSVTVCRLAQGDYLIDDRLLVERKRLPDLVISIKDGRLFSQALRLLGTEQHPMMILEGTATDLAGSGMRREAIQGALVMVTIYLGIPLLRSRNLQESVQLMLYAARQGKSIATGALPRRGRRTRGKRATQIGFLQGLPNVGTERAGRLLDHFGSIENIVTASVQELTRVEGIGSKTAESIRWVVKEPMQSYEIKS